MPGNRPAHLLATDIDALAEVDLHLYGRLAVRQPKPAAIRPIPGEISEREGRLLYQLAAEVWDGRGNVLEVGTLFGASTQWLGRGMVANGHRQGRLIAADAFGVYFPAAKMVEQLQPLLGDRADWPEIAADFEQVGFRRAFDALHAAGRPYSDFLTIVRCLVPSAPGEPADETRRLCGESGPVGLLSIDSVKSWYPVRALAIEIVEQLLPGALIAWQDHRWFNSFAISFLNQRLGEHMQLIAIADTMQVYRYTGGLDADAILQAMPETVAEVPADDLRAMFRSIAWNNYIRNDAYGVLSATLQLAFALASQGLRAEAESLYGAAATMPGFGAHGDMLRQARLELSDLGG